MSRTAGNRNAKRIAVVYPVRLWGMDATGRPFIEVATTLNVSRSGVLLKGVPTDLVAGDVIGLRAGEQKCRFRVVWVGQEGTPDAGHLGLQSLEPEKHIWDLNLPTYSIDIYTRAQEHERRLINRLGCLLSAEVGSDNSAGRVRAVLTDISPGGCYVSMQEPFALEARVTVGLWLSERDRLWTDGIVISRHLGLGMGVKFLNLSRKNLEDLTEFIEHLPKPQPLWPVGVNS